LFTDCCVLFPLSGGQVIGICFRSIKQWSAQSVNAVEVLAEKFKANQTIVILLIQIPNNQKDGWCGEFWRKQ